MMTTWNNYAAFREIAHKTIASHKKLHGIPGKKRNFFE